MPYNPDIHHRRSIRLKGYDYSLPGAYFITLCVKNRVCLFGAVQNGIMNLNEYGKIVKYTWHDLIHHIADIVLDEYVVMPNHFHGIVIIAGAGSDSFLFVRAGSEPAPTNDKNNHAPAMALKRQGLPEIVRQLKTFSARRINELRQTPGVPVWQRDPDINRDERIIRDENELNRIREYIIHNPANWESDKDYLALHQ